MMVDGLALETFNGVHSAISLAGGSQVNSDSGVLISFSVFKGWGHQNLFSSYKEVNTVNKVNEVILL